MKTISIFRPLIVVLFCGYYILSFAQNIDASSGTFYQVGGKLFEIIDKSNNIYQIKLSVKKTDDVYNLEIINHVPVDSSKKVFSFVNFDRNTLTFGIKKLAPGIDDKSAGELADQMVANRHNYDINKITTKFEEQLSKEKKNIGKLGFRKSLNELYVHVYNYNKDTLTKKYPKVGFFKVESAQIAFGDGVVSKINVNGILYKINEQVSSSQISLDKLQESTQKRIITFYNFLPPLPIRKRDQIDYFNICDGNERYWLTAQWQDIDDSTGKFIYFIYLSDVLFYEQNLIYNYGVYIPPDGKVINLNDSVEVFDLRKESFINDFDLRIYTDFTGLSANNPNGLMKFMGSYNLKLKSPAFKANQKELESESQSQTLKNCFEYTNIFFNFNKLESDKLILPVKISNKRIYSTSFDLYRYSKFELGIALNLLKLRSDYYAISLDFLTGTYHTPIDSIFTDNGDTLSINDGVNSFYTGAKINFNLQANEYVGFNVGYCFIIPQLISDNKLREISKPINDPKFSENLRGPFLKSNFWIHNIYTEFSLYPDPQDKSSFLFLKSEIIFNSSDNYITLLLGYSLPFSNLISIGQSLK